VNQTPPMLRSIAMGTASPAERRGDLPAAPEGPVQLDERPHLLAERLGELELLVAAGLAPADALTAATGAAAEALGASGSFGGTRPGMRADLVLVEGDPLAGIAATRRIRMVIQGGHVVLDRLR